MILTCHVTGHPQPKITWLKDQDHLPTSPRFQTSQSKEGICMFFMFYLNYFLKYITVPLTKYSFIRYNDLIRFFLCQI